MASAVPRGALPVPPPPGPFKVQLVSAGTWYRVHEFDGSTGKFGPAQFNDSIKGDARFSPLIAQVTDPVTGLLTQRVIPTIYAAATPRGAIAEIVLHDVPTPSTGYLHDWERDKASKLHLSEVGLARLRLVDLTSIGMKAAGLKLADLFSTEKPDYPRTRDWALYIWQNLPAAQGLRWMSVRDNTCPVVMLFGDRVRPGDCQGAGAPYPIANFEAEVLSLLDALGCGLVVR